MMTSETTPEASAPTLIFTHKIHTKLVRDYYQLWEALKEFYGTDFSWEIWEDGFLLLTVHIGTPVFLKEKLQEKGVLFAHD